MFILAFDNDLQDGPVDLGSGYFCDLPVMVFVIKTSLCVNLVIVFYFLN